MTKKPLNDIHRILIWMTLKRVSSYLREKGPDPMAAVYIASLDSIVRLLEADMPKEGAK